MKSNVFKYFEEIEKPASFVFQRMEQRGIRIDLPYLNNLKTTLENKKKPIELNILNALGSINLNSPQQLLEALHAKGINPEYKNKPSTDRRGLERLVHIPVIANLLSYSELDTLLSNFVYPYLNRNTEIVHPNFNQTGTRTGRPSCSKPNLLQIPRRTENGKLVRRMFIGREGCLIGDCDFGQIESRVFAHLSKDKAMCEMFNKGIDFHSFTSQNRGIDREKAKVLNLSVGFRATCVSVARQLNCTEGEAQDEIDRWWDMFPGLFDWQQKIIYESKRSGYCTTLMGRQIKVDNLNEYNKWKREHAERQLLNNICQASAAEVMKLAMINVDKAGINTLVQVYDELVIEEKTEDIENAMHIAIDIMEHNLKLEVPLVVDANVGCNWEEAKRTPCKI